jgi:hypothetical protein
MGDALKIVSNNALVRDDYKTLYNQWRDQVFLQLYGKRKPQLARQSVPSALS